mmetsp:Transcript_55291/g.160497  ORF Transcript_55291/g.160497 Transcript_55291/m.160497 type:complete len:305 (+) Transcript_55291:246-1160(+)
MRAGNDLFVVMTRVLGRCADQSRCASGNPMPRKSTNSRNTDSMRSPVKSSKVCKGLLTHRMSGSAMRALAMDKSCRCVGDNFVFHWWHSGESKYSRRNLGIPSLPQISRIRMSVPATASSRTPIKRFSRSVPKKNTGSVDTNKVRKCDGMKAPRSTHFGYSRMLSNRSTADFPSPCGPSRNTKQPCGMSTKFWSGTSLTQSECKRSGSKSRRNAPVAELGNISAGNVRLIFSRYARRLLRFVTSNGKFINTHMRWRLGVTPCMLINALYISPHAVPTATKMCTLARKVPRESAPLTTFMPPPTV